eukprot:gene895-1732_t
MFISLKFHTLLHIILCQCNLIFSFVPNGDRRNIITNALHKSRSRQTQEILIRKYTALQFSGDATTALIAVGDFAAEIEGSVGTEIYAPIFRAGLFIVFSGFISAIIAGVLVNAGDSWDELGMEFERGKEAQLIPEVKQEITTASISENSESKNESEDIKFLDL